MAKDIPSKKYKGVYYRQLKNNDRSYFIILRIQGKQKRVSIGKKSEGITEAYAFQQKVHIINAEKFGDDQAEILQRTKKADPTFTEIGQHYIEHARARDNTKRQIGYLVNMVPWRDQRRVTERDVSEWLTKYSRTVKPGTVNNKINLLNSVFQHGIDHKLYRHDSPMRHIKKNSVDDKRLRWLTREEVATLLEALRDQPMLYLFTKLALSTGARLSTLVLIHSADIRGNTVRLRNVKTARDYTGYLDAECQQLLAGRQGYVLSMRGEQIPPEPNEYQWRLRRVFDRLFNEGVSDSRDRVVIHTLRHTTASLLVQNGTPLHVVQRVLDHQSIRSTERYAKIHEDTVKNEVERLWN